MPESQAHINLVRQMRDFVISTYLNGDDGSLYLDSPENPPEKRPPNMGGAVPDLFVSSCKKYATIVGEAKPGMSIEARRVEKQVGVFLNYCASHQPSLLVVAVRWDHVILAKNEIRRIQRLTSTQDVEFKVPEMFFE